VNCGLSNTQNQGELGKVSLDAAFALRNGAIASALRIPASQARKGCWSSRQSFVPPAHDGIATRRMGDNWMGLWLINRSAAYCGHMGV
jgi:hypothetical protein